DQQRRHRRSVADVALVTGQYRPDPGLAEDAGGWIEFVEPLEQRAVDRDQIEVGIKCPAAFIGPRPRYRPQARDCKRLRPARPRPRETVADTDVAALRAAVEARRTNDLFLRQPGDPRGPGGIARLEVRLEPFGVVGVAGHVVPVGVAFLE